MEQTGKQVNVRTLHISAQTSLLRSLISTVINSLSWRGGVLKGEAGQSGRSCY
jgi:hypothetical protein